MVIYLFLKSLAYSNHLGARAVNAPNGRVLLWHYQLPGAQISTCTPGITFR